MIMGFEKGTYDVYEFDLQIIT